MTKNKANKISAKTLKDGIERRKKLRNCPKFGDHLAGYEDPVDDDTPTPVRDLLPAAEDCYKALRELPSYCLSAWAGQKIANRVRNYIEALEKELTPMRRKEPQCGATFELVNGEFVSPCHKLEGHIGSHEGYCLGSPCVWPQGFGSEQEISEETTSNPGNSVALGWIEYG